MNICKQIETFINKFKNESINIFIYLVLDYYCVRMWEISAMFLHIWILYKNCSDILFLILYMYIAHQVFPEY